MRTRLHVTVFASLVGLAIVLADATPRLEAAGAGALVRSAASADTFDSPVADAAMRGDVEAVRTLLRAGTDVNAAQGDGMTALHWAAERGDVETMNLVLVAGAATESLTRLGRYTPLHLASANGHSAAVARLLEAGSVVTAVTSTGVQPIHLAAQAGNPDAVRALLSKGADANVKDETHGRSPLVFATSENRVEAMKVLLKGGADNAATTKIVDYTVRTAADNAARQARDRDVSATTGRANGGNAGGGLYNDPANPGAAAAAAGRGGRGGRGAAPDPDDPAGSARGGRAGAPDPNAGGFNAGPIGRQGGFAAIHYAARDGFVDAARLLLDSGVDVNLRTTGNESTPMLVAIINGQFDLAKLFVERGANPNLTSDDGVTPLFAVLNNEWALRTWYPQPTASQQQRTSYLQLMEVLLKAGADPNARTRVHVWYAAYNAGRMGVEFTGATAFWRAAYALDVDAMRLLVTSGADPNIPTAKLSAGRGRGAGGADPSGLAPVPVGGPHVPPFHAASGVGYGTSRVAQQHRHVPGGWLPATRYFVEDLGVDINVRDADGFTALHHAAARGDNELIRYLVEKGADVMVVSRGGQTTVDMANSPEQRTQPFPETIKLLESMGAKNNNNCQACK